jgi:hypothetical protein
LSTIAIVPAGIQILHVYVNKAAQYQHRMSVSFDTDPPPVSYGNLENRAFGTPGLFPSAGVGGETPAVL